MKIVAETFVRENDYDSLFQKRDWIGISLIENFGVYSVVETIKYHYINIDYTVGRSELILEGTTNFDIAQAEYFRRIKKWEEKYKEREDVH